MTILIPDYINGCNIIATPAECNELLKLKSQYSAPGTSCLGAHCLGRYLDIYNCVTRITAAPCSPAVAAAVTPRHCHTTVTHDTVTPSPGMSHWRQLCPD